MHGSTAPAPRGIIGMVDTGLDADHPGLVGRPIETQTVRGPGHPAARTQHGTDVAILLTRGIQTDDQAQIIAIDAFHRRGGSDNADSFDLVGALDLLAQRNVRVVNLSLAGPANALLERIGQAMQQRGTVLVAAAGNDGPGAEARYPAAYSWAVAVTAIDRDERIYARANRGSHIAFAAPGVRIQLSDKALRPAAPRSGTSYAAPLVTLAFAQRIAREDVVKPQTVLAALSVEARDLGEPGHDPVFGWGRLSCSP
ncbi:Subtilase family protein [Bosea sp. CRIB-10]|uniref:S8 family serine peptidase n=1 Tax=Bosea sp. CRIB-10 TaxID=378404 RepID=UPI0008E21421|nr:S8 family serine peptidase [Bosea sp. CRIB-10]SFD71026.1 Subtilase family protein [Bosea sp. CRIB-10]